jgi:hypothetical protein
VKTEKAFKVGIVRPPKGATVYDGHPRKAKRCDTFEEAVREVEDIVANKLKGQSDHVHVVNLDGTVDRIYSVLSIASWARKARDQERRST